MSERKSAGSAAATGFGFGLGGCLGLIAIPVVLLLLMVNSCSEAVRNGREKRLTEEPRREIPHLTVLDPTTSISKGFAVVDVSVRNDTDQVLASAVISCLVSIDGQDLGATNQPIGQVTRGMIAKTEHRIKSPQKTGRVVAVCRAGNEAWYEKR